MGSDYPITDTIAELKRLQNRNRKLQTERDEINHIAKKQRIEIRRLKRLLDKAVSLIPQDVKDDKFFIEADEAVYKAEL